MIGSWQGNRPMTIFGLAVVAALVVYFVFMALNGFWLEQTEGTARVLEKRVLQGGQTYYNRIVNGRPVVLWINTPEAYLLQVEVSGEKAECVVPRSEFEAVRPGSEVRLVYQRRRLTGGIMILDTRTGGKEDR